MSYLYGPNKASEETPKGKKTHAKAIESWDNATEEEGDKANDERNADAVNATITSQSIISAQRPLNGILTPEMRSHIDRIACRDNATEEGGMNITQ